MRPCKIKVDMINHPIQRKQLATKNVYPILSHAKAGAMSFNHTQSTTSSGLRLKTKVKAGGLGYNYNQTMGLPGKTSLREV